MVQKVFSIPYPHLQIKDWVILLCLVSINTTLLEKPYNLSHLQLARFLFGFECEEPRFPQLLRALGVESQSQMAQEIEENLKEIWKRNLSLQSTPKDQPAAMSRIESELRESQPGLYDGTVGEKALYIAIRVITRYHTRGRSNQRKRLQPRKTRTGGKIVSSISKRLEPKPADTPLKKGSKAKHLGRTDNKDGPSVRYTRSLTKSKAVFLSPRSKGDSIVSAPRSDSIFLAPGPKENLDLVQKNLEDPHTRLRNSYTRANAPALGAYNENTPAGARVTLARDHGFQLQATRNGEPVPSVSTPVFPAISTQRLQRNGFTVVHQFLATCKPPMDHFLRNFIDFGCSSAEYLYSISTWMKERRHSTIKRILTEVEGGPHFTEMDILVLSCQFENYKF
ncbi:hypothetical protein GALMADRAFT_244344 [Galerina marginata CBS 339.88]|uniref:Uncharacterized protein n=1 Tax=Galerina marginata (strain CBS 339.88) TaxID=685588 RepID=A0A067T8V3_GALM3|nr:hypothetical protein GALMADRAFT_244344 [Galerina marginata CBS 339.88]